eukprot:gene4244-6023_t
MMFGGDDDAGGSNFGVNRFDEKHDANTSGAGLDDVEGMGALLSNIITKDLPTAASSALKEIKEIFTPGFVRRMTNKQVHLKQVDITETYLDSLPNKVSTTIKKDLENKKGVRERTRIVKELIEAKKHLREEVKVAVDNAKKTSADEEFRLYAMRRDAQIAEEKENKLQLEKKKNDKMEKDVVELRQWRIAHYSKQSKALSEESEQLLHSQSMREKDTLQNVNNEWDDRAIARSHFQIVSQSSTNENIKLPSGAELGVFSDDNHFTKKSEYVHHDIHVFSVAPHPEYEDLVMDFNDAESNIAYQQSMYDAIQFECKSLNDTIDKMCELRNNLEKDMRQVTQELLIIENDQHGPPRRLASTSEVLSVDAWKNRYNQIQSQIQQLQYVINKSEVQKRNAHSQGLGIAKQIAILKEEANQIDKVKDTLILNGDGLGLGQLPMIIGKNISKASNTDLNQITGQPLTAYNAITQQSRLIDIKRQAEEAIHLHKENDQINQQLWLEGMEKDGLKSDVERVYTKLTDIALKLQNSKISSLRLNIIDSLKGFLASQFRLNVVNKKMVGLLPWFTHVDRLLSSNIEKYSTTNLMGCVSFDKPHKPNSNVPENDELNVYSSGGITLGDSKSGFCCGMISLPKATLWSILVTISKQQSTDENKSASDREQELIDESDFVTVSMGPTLTSLSNLGTYFKKVNPETGTILYDIKYLFRGNSFAFRFDFSSSSTNRNNHLAICTGLYEEYEMKELEVTMDPKFPSRARCLSSYIKMLRIEESTGKLRLTKLLEELIAIEDSTNQHWDTDITNQVMQRYDREYFLRILYAEILLQQQIELANSSAKPVTSGANITSNPENDGMNKQKSHKSKPSKALMANVDLIKEAKLEQSKKRYLMKKRNSQRKQIDDANDLVTKRIVVYDDELKKWRNLTIISCNIQWVENGLKALISHNVQEYNDGFEKINEPFLINLSKYKYFLAHQQVVDVETIRAWREKKAWNERLEQINLIAQEVTTKYNKEFISFKRKEEKKTAKSKEKMMITFDENIEKEANTSFKKPVAKKFIRLYREDILVEIEKGIVVIEDNKDVPDESKKSVKSKSQQINDLIKSRYIEDFIENARKKLELQIEEMEGISKELIRSKYVDNKDAIAQVLNDANSERNELKKSINEKLRMQKNSLLQRIKFPPQVWKKVLPVVYNCEHLKTKAWGNNYGKGVKCMTCGKEIGDIEKEESQILGYGSGADVELSEALKRHRQNEASFRFTSSNQLQLIENERLRLEKERRELELNEAYFYDFQDLKVIYEFDHRHSKSIKEAGIFRQGLQWTEDELKAFEFESVRKEQKRITEMGLPLESAMEGFDPLSIVQDPPPTARGVMERHAAQYKELTFMIGRLQTYSRRINEYKMERFELLSEREFLVSFLESLHKDSYQVDNELASLESDLDKTSKLIHTFESMQRLWKQATLIQHEASRSVKKAEMKRCGVWETVKECHEKTSFLHEETINLLKIKYLMETNTSEKGKLKEYLLDKYVKNQEKFFENEQLALSLQYCKPGNLVYTPFGYQCVVVSYRAADDMVLVLLPFCKPSAKAYIHARQIINIEQSKQKAEVLLMGKEEENNRKCIVDEKIKMKKELYLMAREEEGLKRYWEFVDLGKYEKTALLDSINGAVDESFAITETKTFNKLITKPINEAVKKLANDRKAKRKVYKGPPSGKPKVVSTWEMYTIKKTMANELKQKFILEAANLAESKTQNLLLEARSNWIQSFSFENLISVFIKEMILEIAVEAQEEGKTAKLFAEKKSGIFLPKPAWMQYHTYQSLSSITRVHKDELLNMLEINKGAVANAIANFNQSDDESEGKNKNFLITKNKNLSSEDIKKMKMEKKLIKLEKQRQLKLCDEMLQEEIKCREFYRWELKENLRERRMMKEEERLCVAIKQEEIKQMQELQNKILLMGGGNNISVDKKDFSYEKRRIELKELTLERRRRSEDQAYMILEDALGHDLREMDRVERQKKAFMAEFGLSENDLSGTDPNNNGEEDETNNVNYEAISGKKLLPIPSWLTLPMPAWDKWDILTQNKYLRMMVRIHKKNKQIERNIIRQSIMFEKLEMKSYQEWLDNYCIIESQKIQSELDMIESYIEYNENQAELVMNQENFEKINYFCQMKGEEELKSQTEEKIKTEYARLCDFELDEAKKWLSVCQRRAKTREKLKRRVTSDCKYVDTDSINGFHQRFSTEQLRNRIYAVYFRSILSSIINRTEIITTERRLFLLQEKISFNKQYLVNRIHAMQRLIFDIRREEYLRMKRSVLGQKFFSRSRRNCLDQRFSSWVRYYMWNRGHKEAFQLKYEIIKQQLEIDRQFKKQLQTKKQLEEERHMQLLASGNKNYIPKTILQKHRERIVSCQNCKSYYLESFNNSMACKYHPQEFSLQCPMTCPDPGKTALCIAHRKRRWLCCDSVIFSTIGCARKNHVPQASDPTYDDIISKIIRRDEAVERELDSKLIKARESDFYNQVNFIKKNRRFEVEDEIEKDRTTAQRYKDLKFI